MNRALRELQKQREEKEKSAQALLAEEAEKWKRKSISANLAHGATVTIANATEAVGPVEDSVIYCTNSGFDTVATSYSLSHTGETDLDGVCMWDGTSWGSTPVKKKSELDRLLVDINVSSLDSLTV